MEIRTGNPFRGREKEKLVSFLKEQDLEYDENITYSMVLEEDGEIIGTASSHNNVIKCVAISKEHQGENLLSTIFSHLVTHMFEQGIYHYFGFTKPKNKRLFEGVGLYPVAETDHVLLLENERDGIKKYMKKLQEETKMTEENGMENKESDEIGAIVANCNPFTKGHRYLVEYAASRCRYLHLFILSEEQEFISSDARFHMVSEGIKDLKNVILHRTSDYLISPVVFPTYFMKEKDQAFTMNCMLDIEIFRRYIAKNLGITKRFVGSEPNCQVTNEYNRCLKEYLPQSGIEVEEIKRLEIDDMPVSASDVRRAYEGSRMEDVKRWVPETTYQYLSECKK